MKIKLPIFVSLSLFTISAPAAVLIELPSPMAQGGMIHVNVSLQGTALHAHAAAGTPELRPLGGWSPGDTFSPASPWYTTLDPEQGGGLFNSQFGLVLDGEVSDPLPFGSRILVSMTAASPSLEVYRWRNSEPQLFDAILGTDGSAADFDWSTMSHAMMHPMFVAPSDSNGPLSATLVFRLVDGEGNPLAGYTGTSSTLNFTAIPEPTTAGLVAFSLLITATRRRRQSASQTSATLQP